MMIPCTVTWECNGHELDHLVSRSTRNKSSCRWWPSCSWATFRGWSSTTVMAQRECIALGILLILVQWHWELKRDGAVHWYCCCCCCSKHCSNLHFAEPLGDTLLFALCSLVTSITLVMGAPEVLLAIDHLHLVVVHIFIRWFLEHPGRLGLLSSRIIALGVGSRSAPTRFLQSCLGGVSGLLEVLLNLLELGFEG